MTTSLIVEPASENRHAESVAITDAIGNVCFPVDVKIISERGWRKPEQLNATRMITMMKTDEPAMVKPLMMRIG